MDKELNQDIDRELKAVEKDILIDKYKTAREKIKFISEIKTGLGNQIRSNPTSVKFIKKTWKQKVKLFFKEMFTKF